MLAAKREWIDIVKKQEELLRFEQFTRDDALGLGLKVIEMAREKYHHGVTVRIFAEGAVLFSHMMDECSLENELWMTRKFNTSSITRISSMRTFLEIHYGIRQEEAWCKNSGDHGNYALCGGCMPIFGKNGETHGFVMVSALSHEEDHQLIADSMAAYLDVEIPSIL
ncbi:heme-binding protein [Christensenella tenuis]|uniref:Heme-binding protein n=1 Tax=Christensenella tenuis TaxID=2763033 RepID=A0ABR7EAV1_9FIRM|nr:heme-binding protein [Christensenella tenuis]MBC5646793.1 heme-binding protein [Christensenella tenuis]